MFCKCRIEHCDDSEKCFIVCFPANNDSAHTKKVALTSRIFEWNFAWRSVCTRLNGVYRRNKGRADGRGHTPCPLSIAYLCGSLSSCCSLHADRQSAGPNRAFLTVEVSQQPEPRGGRWEEAESPQLPHRTASLTAARGRSHPHQPMSTVGSLFISFFKS